MYFYYMSINFVNNAYIGKAGCRIFQPALHLNYFLLRSSFFFFHLTSMIIIPPVRMINPKITPHLSILFAQNITMAFEETVTS